MTSSKKITRQTVSLFHKKIKEAKRIAISGHMNPDGDCVGACLGLYTYILDLDGEKQVDLLLEPISEKFLFLKYAEKITQEKNRGGAVRSLYCSGLFRYGTTGRLPAIF